MYIRRGSLSLCSLVPSQYQVPSSLVQSLHNQYPSLKYKLKCKTQFKRSTILRILELKYQASLSQSILRRKTQVRPTQQEIDLTPLQHAINEFPAFFLRCLIPYLPSSFPKLLHTGRDPLVVRKLSLEVFPQMFNRVKVWRLWRPVQDFNYCILEPLLYHPGCMLGVIIMLEDNIL